MILPHLELRYGHEDIFTAVQDTVLSIFNAMANSQVDSVRHSSLTIWIDDSPSCQRLLLSERNLKQWRLFIGSDGLCQELVEFISNMLYKRVGWIVTGWQPFYNAHATPIFRYERGDFQAFIMKEEAKDGFGRFGYIDIESDGVAHKIVVVEMDATRIESVCIAGRTGTSETFQARFIDAAFGNETVSIEANSMTDVKPAKRIATHATPALTSEVQIPQPRIFYLNNFVTLSSCIE